VVSSTATQLYAGTAYLTGVNGTPISAARAGNAANATQATSAWYDGTGRLISALPDEATVSAIASAYADDKLDKTAQVVTATAGDGTYVTSINGMEISGQGGGGGGDAFPVDYNSGSCSASLETGYFVSTSRPSLTLSSTGTNIYPRFIVRNGTGTASKGSYYLSDAFEFTTGTAGGSGTKVLRVDPQQVSSKNFLLFGPSGSNTYGTLALGGADDSAYVRIGSGTEGHVNYVRPSSISSWWDVHDTVSANSASWGGGGGVVTSTASASAGDPLIPIYYVNKINGSGLYAVSAEESEFAQYDTNGRLLLEIPGSAEVSAIASAYSESAASLPITGAQGEYSASHGISSVDFTYGEDGGASNLYTGSINVSSIEIDYTPDNEEFYSTQLTHNYLNFTGPNHNQSMGPSEIEYWNDVATTVSTESGNWGGVDEATVSSIASSYAESSVSSKADSSSLSSYALSADVSGCIDTVSANSASWGGGATGDYVEKSSYQNSLGTSNTVTGATTGSMYMINGTGISASLGGAYVQLINGSKNTAHANAFINGYNNLASGGGSILGTYSNVTGMGLAVGTRNTLNGYGLTVGSYNTAYGNSMCIGGNNSASSLGYAFGSGLKIKNVALALGAYNSASDGTNVALVIGDGYVYNDGGWHTANHDLMVVTKDGEITMYSSTADMVGTGIMSSIRAISAAATGGGGDVYISGFSYNATDISAIEGSALYDKSAHSRITTVAGRVTNLSAAVSGTVDLVSTQSANWGGSALALSAGPGVKLEKVGDTLVFGADETVLWSSTGGSSTTDTACTLSEAWTHFDHIDIWYRSTDGRIERASLNAGAPVATFMLLSQNYNGTNWWIRPTRYNISNNAIAANVGAQYTFTDNAVTRSNTSINNYLYKVVGINRTAGV
jgi:hypothetical protein